MLHTKIHCLSKRALNVLSPLFKELQSTKVQQNLTLSGYFDGKSWVQGQGPEQIATCPSTGEQLARVNTASVQQTEQAIANARDAYLKWRVIPPAKRSDLLLALRAKLYDNRKQLGALISLEQGKILSEGQGEVQEAIDILDYAVGLGRQIGSKGVGSERAQCNITEIPNPLGVVGILSASNFPVAVFFWNFAISLITGNSNIWKGSPQTNLCSIACTKLISDVLQQGDYPKGLLTLVCGHADVGETIVDSKSIDLVSFTGSEKVGRLVGMKVASRFGKSLLELGGNNAAIVMEDANMELALSAVLFASIGTAGQRCTSTRRLFLHKPIAQEFIAKLKAAYSSIKIGDPLESTTLMGPVHGQQSVSIYNEGIDAIKNSKGQIITGGSGIKMKSSLAKGSWVAPTLALHQDPTIPLFHKETFAPILNIAIFDELDQAITWNNSVPQGLSSTIFTRNIQNIGKWTGPEGSDCGIVNVNVSTSGAEIGAGFGGNKSTGWGRESGGDSWKQYVRWSACTLNYGDSMPLAQGVSFETELTAS